MHSTASPDGPASRFRAEILALWQDPAIWRLAVRRAGSRELAEDALQETFCAMARVRDPERIENLRAFFRTALIHEIDHQRWQLRPRPAENPETLARDQAQDLLWSQPVPHAVDQNAVWIMITETWFAKFRRDRARLRGMIPGRSGCPGCYRDAVIAVAEAILRAAVAGRVSRADWNEALQAAQPDWFDAPGCPQNTLYQRFSRAREDVRLLLTTVVNREDLSP